MPPTCNLGWRNHPNFLWNQGEYQGSTSVSAAQLSCSQFARPNAVPYQNQPAFVNPYSAHTYANPPIPPPGFENEQEKKLSTMEKTFNSFMQTTTQMLNSNHQAINRLELQVSQWQLNLVREKREDSQVNLLPIPRTQGEILLAQLSSTQWSSYVTIGKEGG